MLSAIIIEDSICRELIVAFKSWCDYICMHRFGSVNVLYVLKALSVSGIVLMRNICKHFFNTLKRYNSANYTER